MEMINRKLWRADIIIQALLIIPMVFFSICPLVGDNGVLLFGLMLQFVVGVYHFFHVLVNVARRSSWHWKYGIGIIIYFLILFGFSIVGFNLKDNGVIPFVIYIIVIPQIMAVYYIFRNYNDYRNIMKEYEMEDERGMMDDILDEGFYTSNERI